MDPKPSSEMLLAPPPNGSAAVARLPGRDALPGPNEHLVIPEVSRDEMIRGRRVVAMPANPPHADRQFGLSYIIGAHLKPGYIGSSDLLTRVNDGSDFATDVCVRRSGNDPATGQRHLEELSFEVVNEQSERDIREKAEDLVARGIRTIAIFVKKGQVCEWKSGRWVQLDPEATFADPTLAQPIRVRALLDAAEADDAVAQALLAKGNRVVLKVQEDGRAEGLRDGRAEGLRAAVRDLCEVLSVEITPERERALAEMTAAELDALRANIKRERRWA